jgi:hypothetical protein
MQLLQAFSETDKIKEKKMQNQTKWQKQLQSLSLIFSWCKMFKLKPQQT